MKPSLNYLIHRFTHFNEHIFDNRLPLPEMKLTSDIYRAGCTTSTTANGITQWTIRISIRFDRPVDHYDNVLVHEMIHYYIGYCGIKDDGPHGRFFVNMMKEINSKYGMGIEVSGLFPDSVIAQFPHHQRYFCIVRFQDGQIAIQVAAKNKVLQLWDFYDAIPYIKDVRWFTSTDPKLGLFPLTSGPSFQFIDEDKAYEMMEKAFPISR